MTSGSDQEGTGNGAAPPEPNRNNLPRQARLRSERHARFEREGERPIGRNLALMGSLGWLIVIPALLGMGAGIWLDRTFNTGRVLERCAAGRGAWHWMLAGLAAG